MTSPSLSATISPPTHISRGRQSTARTKPVVTPSDRTLCSRTTVPPLLLDDTSELPAVSTMETSSLVATNNNAPLPQTDPSEPFLHLVESLLATHTMSELRRGIAGMPATNAS